MIYWGIYHTEIKNKSASLPMHLDVRRFSSRHILSLVVSNDQKLSKKQVLANSADPDQTGFEGQSDQFFFTRSASFEDITP